MKTLNFSKLVLTLILLKLSTSVNAAENGPWDLWYKKSFVKALLYLKDVRKELEKKNLFDFAAENSPDIRPQDCINTLQRQSNGACTDLKSPLSGMAGSLLGRNFKPQDLIPYSHNTLDPDPRKLSRELMTRTEFKPSERLNFLGVAWIQFMIHDWIAHEDLGDRDVHFLQLSKDDPLYKKYGQDHMVFTQTRPVRTSQWDSAYVNKVTHWWDGSQIYGSDESKTRSLRSFRKGEMRLQNELLPLDENGQELTGANPNWWVGLGLMHTIFVREHNAIAGAISQAYPQMSDEEIFQKTRLINAALMAKIHALEFSQVELDHRVTRFGTKVNWYGLLTALKDRQNNHSTDIDPVFEKLFPHSQTLQGIVGGPTRLSGVVFSQTTELGAVYRYHTLLPDTLNIISPTGSVVKKIPLQNTRFAQSHQIFKTYGVETILRSFGLEMAGAIALNNLPNFMQELEVPVMGVIDLGALDIWRDRERSVPRYNQFRRLVGLKPLDSIEQLGSSSREIEKMKALYHNDIEKVDLQIGMLAESNRPGGFIFGETQFQLISLMATRRLMADRFYTEDYRPEVYTKLGLEWIDKTNFKDLLTRHYPGLKKSLEKMTNPFRPWRR